MKTTGQIFILLLVIGLCSGIKTRSIDPQAVNSIVGNQSLKQKFGSTNPTSIPELTILQTHLEYVENLLRKRDVRQLKPELRKQRKRMLDLLREYRLAGNFPRNFDRADRRIPCFIDRDGRICAVGYLVAKTSGRKVAEAINAAHHNEYILSMNDPMVNAWVATSGLTMKECAMIQPGYAPTPTMTENYITPAYGITSSVLGGTNMAISIVNTMQISKGRVHNTVPLLGLISGAGQLTLGMVNLHNSTIDKGMFGTVNVSMRNISLLNMGIGTTSIVVSSINLIASKKLNTSKAAVNLFGYPVSGQSMAVGVSYTRRI